MRTGSEKIPSSSTAIDLRKFRGRAFDHEATIVYQCVRGALIGGSFVFPATSPEDSLQVMHDLYDKIAKERGVAEVDSSPWRAITDHKDHSQTIPKTDIKYLVVWQTGGSRLTLALESETRRGAMHSQVLMFVAPPKMSR